MEATSFLLIKSVLFWKRQTNHYKSELNNPNHYCQCLTLITIIRPADTDVFLVVTSLHLKSNASYFSGAEKRQLEIHLCLQAVLNPNHDKQISGSNSNRANVREGKTPCFPLSSPPTVYLFFPHATTALPPTEGDMGV